MTVIVLQDALVGDVGLRHPKATALIATGVS